MGWHEPDSRYHVPIKRCEVAIYFKDGTHVTDVFNMILEEYEIEVDAYSEDFAIARAFEWRYEWARKYAGGKYEVKVTEVRDD